MGRGPETKVTAFRQAFRAAVRVAKTSIAPSLPAAVSMPASQPSPSVSSNGAHPPGPPPEPAPIPPSTIVAPGGGASAAPKIVPPNKINVVAPTLKIVAPAPPGGSSAADEETLRTVRVSNLSPTMKVKTLLKELAQAFGEVKSHKIEMDLETRTPFATIEFSSVAAGQSAAAARQLGSLAITPAAISGVAKAGKDAARERSRSPRRM